MSTRRPRRVPARSALSRCLAALAALLCGFDSAASPPAADAAERLRALHATSAGRLDRSPFDRGLLLESRETAGRLEGDVQARIAQPFAVVAAALDEPSDWCEVLLLLPNVRQCGSGTDSVLDVRFVSRFDDAPDESHPVPLRFSYGDGAPDYFVADLRAEEGPVGTRNYRIRIEALAVGNGKTFLHFTYSYEQGLAARLAARTYLATSGRGKAGFTVTRTAADGKPEYIGGLRGAVERNAMRCYLAIGAHLRATAEDPAERFGQSLEYWLDAIGDFPRQLEEEDPAAYSAVKRAAYRRSRASAAHP